VGRAATGAEEAALTAAVVAALVVALSPNPSHFGQLITASVTGPGTPSFAPFAVRARHGDSYVLQCLDPACVPGPGPRVLRIGGRRVVIVPRATAAQVSSPQRAFRHQTTSPPPSYRISPRLLRVLLLLAALALAGVGACALWGPDRRLLPDRRNERTPLERALALARASMRRSVEDRRRALDLLARALGSRGPAAHDALELAWSEPDPAPASIEGLIERVVERT
jgi:hypothetical protein